MFKVWTIGIWLPSLLLCCGCHGPSARARLPVLTTIYLSESANSALEKWIHASPGRRGGNIANTGSMQPTLDERYVVIVEKRPFAGLREGDIVLIDAAWSSDGRVAHRLVSRLAIGWWITRGDANQQSDPLMSERDYAGAVVIAAIEKHTGAVKILDRRARPNTAIAATSRGASGGAFNSNSHVVCSKEL